MAFWGAAGVSLHGAAACPGWWPFCQGSCWPKPLPQGAWAGRAPAEPAQGAWEADPDSTMPLCLADNLSCKCPPERAAELADLIAGINNTHRAGREKGEAEANKGCEGLESTVSTHSFQAAL